MQKQLKRNPYNGSITHVLDNTITSINKAIEHFQDLETQRILKKYGFDVKSIVQDLNESKEDVFQLINSH